MLFSLYLPSLTDRQFPPIGRRDLRALLLVANPPGLEQYDLPPFDEPAILATLKKSLGQIPYDVLGTVPEAVGLPTLDSLVKQLTEKPYTILHIVAHGKYIERHKKTVLYLAKSTAEVKGEQLDLVFDNRLIERLSRFRGERGLPYFTFIGACESAELAQRLVRELGIPAVLAMTEPITFKTAEMVEGRFYQRLYEHGFVDQALVEAVTETAERYDAVVPALYSRLGGRPLFSDSLDRDLTNAEIKFGLEKLVSLIRERSPVLLRPEFVKQAAILQRTLRTDTATLSRPMLVERQETLTKINELCVEILDLSFNGLCLGKEPPSYDARCPFQGLESFKVENKAFFFGREELIKKLVAKLRPDSELGNNFVAVLGPSGSGKSSVVLAGLVPALGYPCIRMVPSNNPVSQLDAALAEFGTLMSNLSHAILVVDQFEEIFTLCPNETERQQFFDKLLTLAHPQRRSQFINLELEVVITMRADFWGECASYTALKETMQANQELIAPMDIVELRNAMEEQARVVGLRFEADLSQTILNEVQGEPGAMPLLQHALRELWQRRHGRWLRAAEYRAIGGIHKAIANTADQIYQQLPPTEQGYLRDIFTRLTRLDETAEHRDTRQRVRFVDLVTEANTTPTLELLVERLATARLVVTSVDATSQQKQVEVTHEALIRHWPLLQQWLADDREMLRLRQGIVESAREWSANSQEVGLLVHRGSRLEEIVALRRVGQLKLNALEQSYIQACLDLQERERLKEEQQRQRLIIFSVVALFLALLAMGFGWQANRSAAEAETQFKIAQIQALAAQAPLDFETDPERALLLANEAYIRHVQINSPVLSSVDRSLRDLLNRPYFNVVFRGHKDMINSPYAVDNLTKSPRWLRICNP